MTEQITDNERNSATGGEQITDFLVRLKNALLAEDVLNNNTPHRDVPTAVDYLSAVAQPAAR